MSKNVYKGVRTTIIGSVLILAGILSVFFAGVSWWPDATIAISIGVAFLFFPDSIISQLRKFISKKTSE